MPYTLHPSVRLRAYFPDTPWQGNNPMEASFIFVGLDANFDADIENSLPEIFDYLDNGVDWWQANEEGVHHPFRLNHYQRDGRRYHDKFAEIGFMPENATLVSFVELLHIPTVGVSNLKRNDLSVDHMQSLNTYFDDGAAKYIFVSNRVTKLMRQTRMFPGLQPNPLQRHGDLRVLREENGKIMYEIYHLSCRYRWQLDILNRQIAQIHEILMAFLDNRDE